MIDFAPSNFAKDNDPPHPQNSDIGSKVVGSFFASISALCLILTVTLAGEKFVNNFQKGNVLAITTRKTISTSKLTSTFWQRQYQTTNAGSIGSVLTVKAYKDLPGKQIIYLDSDKKLTAINNTGDKIAQSEILATQSGQLLTSEFSPTAIDILGRKDGTGKPVYQIVIPVVNNLDQTKIMIFSLEKATNGIPIFSLVAETPYYSEGKPTAAAVVDDLDNDGYSEIYLSVTNTVSATTAVLGWSWGPSGLIPLSNGINPSPIVMKSSLTGTMTGSYIDAGGFVAPAIGNVTSAVQTSKVLVSALNQENSSNSNRETIFLFVGQKTGNTVSYVSNQTAAPYYWFSETIDEPTGTSFSNYQISGVSLADIDGDQKLDIIAGVKKEVLPTSNYTANYSLRIYKDNASLFKKFTYSLKSIGQTSPTKIASAQRLAIIDITSGTNFNISRPVVGNFEGYPKAILIKTTGATTSSTTPSHLILGAYYSGGVLNWIPNYSPRLTNTWSSCNMIRMTTNNSISLANIDGSGNKVLYSKFTGLSPYSIGFYAASGAATQGTCTGIARWNDVSTYSSLSAGSGINGPFYSRGNIDVGDFDGDGTIESIESLTAVTTAYQPIEIFILQPFSSTVIPTDWPQTAAGPCRQGRFGVVSENSTDGCPVSAFVVPTSTITPTPTLGPSPTPTLIPTATPTWTPTPTPTPDAQCQGLKYYKVTGDDPTQLTNWVEIPKTSINPGNKIYITCTSSVINGTIDKAHFKVNGEPSAWGETTLKKPNSNEFYYTYIFPSSGLVTSFIIDSQVHVLENNTWY